MPRETDARRRSAIPLIALVSLLTLCGCTVTSSEPVQPEPEAGPLTKYLSMIGDETEYTRERAALEQRDIEELVAECMTEEGFEYVPHLQSGGGFDPGLFEGGAEAGSVAYAEQYGFGIVDAGDGFVPDLEAAGVDPNQGYLESLGESERQAYAEALNGPPLTEDEAAELLEGGALEPAGCYGRAQREVQGDRQALAAYEDPEFTELLAATERFWTQIYGDGSSASSSTDVAALEGEWSQCMSDAGFGDYVSPSNARSTLDQEYGVLETSDGGEVESREPSREEIQRFQTREIAVAVADAECRQQQRYEDRLEKIQFELEQEFVDEHRDELDAFVAKYAEPLNP